MATSTPDLDGEGGPELSLVRGDASWRFQRILGLIPPDSLGLGRRVVLSILITWVPIMVWAWLHKRMLGPASTEPLLAHYGVHVRCLIAIPLMIAAEGMAHKVMPRIIPYFLTSGVLPPSESGRFRETLRGVLRLRDNTLPWVFILGIGLALTFGDSSFGESHLLDWAREEGTGLGFGGKWFVYVVRPVFLSLLLGWLWRLTLFSILLFRLSRLQFSLVPSHPDGNGGLGFMDHLPVMFAPVIMALSAVMASTWSHEIVYHGTTLQDLRLPMITFLVTTLLLFLGPYFVLMGPLVRAKRAAELEYGALSGQHGRLVRQKWIEGKDVPDEAGLLGAPEMGPVADHITMYQMVEKMRTLPIGKRAVISVLVPAAIPLLIVVSLQVPIKDLLLGLVKAIA